MLYTRLSFAHPWHEVPDSVGYYYKKYTYISIFNPVRLDTFTEEARRAKRLLQRLTSKEVRYLLSSHKLLINQPVGKTV